MDERTIKFVKPTAEKYANIEVSLTGNHITVIELHTVICEYMNRTHPDWEMKEGRNK